MTGDPTIFQDWSTTASTTVNTNITWIGDAPVYPYNDGTAIDPWQKGYGAVFPDPFYPLEKSKDGEDLKRMIEEALSKKETIKEKEEDLMYVYEVTVVDKRKCEILHEQKVIAKDTETAMLDLDLTPDIKKKVKEGIVEFIFNDIGSFKKEERKIKLKDLEEVD